VPTFHVVLSQSGPEFDQARPLEEQSGWAEHAAYMNALVEHGSIVLGGPIGGGRVAHAVEAESEEAVRVMWQRDPWSGTHLVVEAIDPWDIRLDSRAG
jgi:hypothetical protein